MWNIIELRYAKNDVCEVRLNGVVVASQPVAGIESFLVTRVQIMNPSSGGPDYFDDIIVTDGAYLDASTTTTTSSTSTTTTQPCMCTCPCQ